MSAEELRPQVRVRPWLLATAMWILPATFAIVSGIAQRRLYDDPSTGLAELLGPAGYWLIYAFITPVMFWVANRWPVARPHLVRRIVLHIGIALAYCVLWVLFQVSMSALFGVAGGNAPFAVVVGRMLGNLPFGVIVYMCIAGLAHAAQYFTQARDREMQMARLSEQLAGARYSALQAQLNPHFLFNTLNTIAVRARDGDSGGTVRMVEQLTDVLRRTLSRHGASEVPLREEIELVRQYLAIEQARFSDRLHPAFEIGDAALDVAVPSFALQHLVENAIRHGIAKRSGAGDLRVVARRNAAALELVVTDDGAGIDPQRAFIKGHGIENTRERLGALHGDKASLEIAPRAGGGTQATLRVPWRVTEAANAGA